MRQDIGQRGVEAPLVRLGRRLTFLSFVTLVAAVAALAALGPRAARPQELCGAAVLEGVPDRLRAIETERPVTADDFVRRSRELAQLLAAPDARLGAAIAAPCRDDSDEAKLRTLARQRVLLLWGKMIALGAVDGPVFSAPYRRECARFDGTALQVAFVRAWHERLDSQGREVTRLAFAAALEADPLFEHVRDLALRRAQRLRVTMLPTLASDEDAWVTLNEAAAARAAGALPIGVRCGTVGGLWGIEV